MAVKIYGPDLNVLRDLGTQVEAILREVRGVRDLQLEQQINVPEIRVTMNREQAGRLGLNPGDILETTQIAFNGEDHGAARPAMPPLGLLQPLCLPAVSTHGWSPSELPA